MIQFECYSQSETKIFLKIVTSHTEIGTLYRLATAIFVLDLDIFSGEIKTILRNEQSFSEDTFVLRNKNSKSSINDFTSRLGYLMEALLNRVQNPEEILKNINTRKPPTLKEILKSGFDYIIDEIPEKNQIYFYFEAKDRSGLLLMISKFLYENHFNIFEAKIETTFDDIAKDVFYLEYQSENSKKILKEKLEKLLVI
ncbi:MAG: hypothetical protein ACK4UJ_09250 [Leptonema sp. (in: bacteria)]